MRIRKRGDRIRKMKMLVPIVAAMLLVSLTFVASATAGKPGGKGKAPDLEKIVFIHRANGKGPPETPPGQGNGGGGKKYKTLGAKWPESGFPVSYKINPANSGLDPDNVKSEIEQSLNGPVDEPADILAVSVTWDEVITTNLFADSGSFTEDLTADDAGKDDGNNIWVFDSTDMDDSVIAVTEMWINRKTKEIVDADVTFNAEDFTWSLTGESGKMDLQNIATHEAGHGYAGLDHPPDKYDLQTMHRYSDPSETMKRSIEDGDNNGIHEVYG